MARITVEDCVTRVPNRFELVMLAAQRARDVSAGAPLTLDRDNDKNPVVALREIAEASVDLDHLRYELIHGLRRHVEVEDRPDDELMTSYQEQTLPQPDFEDGSDHTLAGGAMGEDEENGEGEDEDEEPVAAADEDSFE